MKKSKSILEETLNDIKEIKHSIEENATFVLKDSLKEDLSAIIKENIDMSDDEEINTDDIDNDTNTDDMGGNEEPLDDFTDGNSEEDVVNSEEPFGPEPNEDDELDPNLGDESEPGEPEIIDLTNADDEEVISNFNLMNPTDEIEIIQTPSGGLQINIEPNATETDDDTETEFGDETSTDDDTETEFGDEISTDDDTETEFGDETSTDDDTETEFGDEENEDDPRNPEDDEDDEETIYEFEIPDDVLNENLPVVEPKNMKANKTASFKPVIGNVKVTSQEVNCCEKPIVSKPKETAEPKVASGGQKGVTGKTGSNKQPPIVPKPKETAEPKVANGGQKGVTGKTGNTKQEIPVKIPKETEDPKVGGVNENTIKLRNKIRDLMFENSKMSKQIEKAKELVENFKENEEQYKKSISTLKKELNEVALYTSNLTYAIKLITENATTKEEKMNIITKLDKAKNINESKEIYNSLNILYAENKKSAKNIAEQILTDNKTTGASKLNEAKVYENPGVKRMLEIMNKIK